MAKKEKEPLRSIRSLPIRKGQKAEAFDPSPSQKPKGQKAEAFDPSPSQKPKDDFTWVQRIKTALQLASLLLFLHWSTRPDKKEYVVCNIDAAHFLLDKVGTNCRENPWKDSGGN
ncbi:protein kinase APK1B, chloroplastic-like protein [Corchorus capsularis]|uniref:Protein kinase APK1B, chloroplastic-like protein n=1 Tax=Corchorus capsularis TaxID=210143 RepID=A0A1R3I2B6_COCAP|nr:protein kinase APK1B, chloroplastic-like protein [Corchorus capsularis]